MAEPSTTTAHDRREANRAFARALKGGVIMDVTTPEQARICLLYTSRCV